MEKSWLRVWNNNASVKPTFARKTGLSPSPFLIATSCFFILAIAFRNDYLVAWALLVAVLPRTLTRMTT